MYSVTNFKESTAYNPFNFDADPDPGPNLGFALEKMNLDPDHKYIFEI